MVGRTVTAAFEAAVDSVPHCFAGMYADKLGGDVAGECGGLVEVSV